MSFPRDLLSLAEHLAVREPKRPRQSSLRRAISTAYYAVFHLLADGCARRFARVSRLRPLFVRYVDHASLRRACEPFRHRDAHRWKPPQPWDVAWDPSRQMKHGIKAIAEEVWELQQRRHEADYDLMQRMTREDAKQAVERARNVFTLWEEINRFTESNAQDRMALDAWLASMMFGRKRA